MAKLFFAGDVLNYTHVDGEIVSKEVEEIITGADYSVCNLEAPVKSTGKKIKKIGPHHYQQEGTIKGLKKIGFDLLTLANNHILDFGTEGLEKTLNLASDNNIKTIGAGLTYQSAYQSLKIEFEDLKIGIVNSCEAQFGSFDQMYDGAGYAWINSRDTDKVIHDLKRECDFIIMYSHAGLENIPIPQKEWRMRYQELCDMGVDVIIGSHPHVPQGYEFYKNSLIFYSLGNFYFDSNNFKEIKNSTYSVLLEINKNKEISFELVFHHIEGGKVVLSSEIDKVNIESLNNMLNDNYDSLIDEISYKTSNELLKPGLVDGLRSSLHQLTFKQIIKKIVKLIINKQSIKPNSLLAYHYIRNESYRFALLNSLKRTSEK